MLHEPAPEGNRAFSATAKVRPEYRATGYGREDDSS